MRAMWRRRLQCILAAAVAAMMLSPQLDAMANLPDRLTLGVGAAVNLPVAAAVSGDVDAPRVAEVESEQTGSLSVTAGEVGETDLTLSLLGLPVRRMRLSVQPAMRLIPGGQSVGVAIRTEGVIVVGASDLGATPSPARLAGLKSGDIIQKIDGEAVAGSTELSAKIGPEAVTLEIVRDGATLTRTVKPARDPRDGNWKLGVWVRDSTAGVGTLTFIDPATGRFGALGHAITDMDTGTLMPVGAGEIYANSVVQVTRSREGSPGELSGDFFTASDTAGDVLLNTECGIFGTTEKTPTGAIYPDGLPVASLREVHPGEATLLTTVNGSQVREYACEIVRLSDHSRSATRSMVIRVTDPELIAAAGGIVQGMSGSPLIQDGRLIGAVTHVMVNDPTMGYGIGIEAMLEAAAALTGGEQERIAA